MLPAAGSSRLAGLADSAVRPLLPPPLPPASQGPCCDPGDLAETRAAAGTMEKKKKREEKERKECGCFEVSCYKDEENDK